MSSTLHRIESDQWSLRKIQNVVTSKTTLAPSTTTLSSPGNSTLSTMADVEQDPPVKYIFQRPKIEPAQVDIEDGETIAIQKFLDQATCVAGSDETPEIKKAYLKIVLELHNLAQEVAASHIGHISKQIRSDSAELEQLNVKKTEEIRKHVLEMQKDSTWSFLSNIMQYFLSASTVVLGGILVGTGVGATAGAFLIAAGGLGLVDRVAKDTGAYITIASYFTKSRELQMKIASWITSTILFVTIGLGITGGIMSSFSSGFDAARTSLTAIDAAKKVEVAIGLASAGIAVGKSNSDKNTAQIQRSLQLIEGRIFLMKQELQRNGSEAKNTINMMQAISTQTKQAITAFH